MTKLPVLVTGGAGYIGSHAVLALTDAGWPVAVIDNLSPASAGPCPMACRFYRGRYRGCGAARAIFAEQGIGAIMHFAGSIVVPESVDDPLKYYHNNTAKSRALIAAAVQGGRAALHLQLDRRDLWHPRSLAGDRGQPAACRSIPMACPS